VARTARRINRSRGEFFDVRRRNHQNARILPHFNWHESSKQPGHLAGGRMKARGEETIEPFDQIDERFEQIEKRFEQVDKSLQALGGGLARLERKLDRILALSVESRGRNR
jgi:hypothetical protein